VIFWCVRPREWAIEEVRKRVIGLKRRFHASNVPFTGEPFTGNKLVLIPSQGTPSQGTPITTRGLALKPFSWKNTAAVLVTHCQELAVG